MSKKKKKPEMPEVIYEKVYVLRHIESGCFLRMERSSNAGADFCGDYTVKIDHYHGDGDRLNEETWYAEEAYGAEFVRQFSTPWFNSCERTPQHGYDPEELEVVELEREVRLKKVESSIPTFEEYMELKYREKEPAHCDYVLGEYKKSPRSFGSSPYSLWDLMMLIENNKWKLEGDNNGTDNKSKSRKSKKKV